MHFGVLAAAAAAALIVCAPASAQTDASAAKPQDAPATSFSAPSLDDFYEPAAFDNAHVSPYGQLIAYVNVSKDAAGLPVSVVIVQELGTTNAHAIFRVGVKGSSIKWLQWKDDDRLLLGVEISDARRLGGKDNAEIVDLKYGQFIIAVDKDGKNERQLLHRPGLFNAKTATVASLLDRLKDDPDHILAIAGGDVWKVDIKTGAFFKVESGSMDVFAWLTDARGNVVVRYRHLGGSNLIEARPPGQQQWSKVATIKPHEFKSLDDFEFLGPAERPAEFYVTVDDPAGGEPNRRLRLYDISTKTLSPPIWADTGHDIESIIYRGDTYSLAGVCYRADLLTCDFANKAASADYRALAKYFQGQRAVVPQDFTDDQPWWLLAVSGPDEPGAYYLFNTKTAHISHLAERYPRLPAERLAMREPIVYAARDGLQIHGYLTRPKGVEAGPLPLVVMPHGGPEARDDLDYNAWAQIVATRGYLVFQPNFRGSSGYGAKFQAAGYHQWGGAMANDVTDGVRRLIETGQADPGRICIFGASYGGYAALYAGATHPELYKCVVSWAGVSDLPKMLDFEDFLYGHDTPTYRSELKMIGDPSKDAAAMRAASPRTYARTYQPPVLLIHGAGDGIVYVEQSKLMYGALKAAGRDATLLLYKDEGHPEWAPPNQKDAFAQVIKFIGAHIAPAKPAPAAP